MVSLPTSVVPENSLLARTRAIWSYLRKFIKIRIPQPTGLPATGHLASSERESNFSFFSRRAARSRPTIVSLVLSFSTLEDFHLSGSVLENTFVTLSHASQRRPLGSLKLYTAESGVAIGLVQSGVRFRQFSLNVYDVGLEQLFTFFGSACGSRTLWRVATGDSEGIGAVVTHPRGQRLPRMHQASESLPICPLPSLPIMTTMNIGLLMDEPCAHLTYVLTSIHLAPALASITFTVRDWSFNQDHPSEGPGTDTDQWLARMALQTKVGGGLTVTLV
jgi:hypothetical protein